MLICSTLASLTVDVNMYMTLYLTYISNVLFSLCTVFKGIGKQTHPMTEISMTTGFHVTDASTADCIEMTVYCSIYIYMHWSYIAYITYLLLTYIGISADSFPNTTDTSLQRVEIEATH